MQIVYNASEVTTRPTWHFINQIISIIIVIFSIFIVIVIIIIIMYELFEFTMKFEQT